MDGGGRSRLPSQHQWLNAGQTRVASGVQFNILFCLNARRELAQAPIDTDPDCTLCDDG